MRRLLFFLLIATAAHAQLYTGVLATARAYDWRQSGISGGIPSNSWSACTTDSPINPYGSSSAYASPSTIINALVANSGKSCYVLLNNGDFYLNAAIATSGIKDVELRSGGPSVTRIHFSGTSTCAGGRGSCFIGDASTDGTYGGGNPPFANWTSGYTQGSSTITIDNGSSIAVGQMIVLDQCNTGRSGSSSTGQCTGNDTDNTNYFNCEQAYSGSSTSWSGTGCSENGPDNAGRGVDSGGVFTYYYRGQQEMAKVVSCSPSCGTSGTITVTLSHPLVHANWTSGQSPQVWWITPDTNVGYRGFAIDGTNFVNPSYSCSTAPLIPSPCYGSLNFGLAFNNVAEFWVQNVAFTNFPDISLFAAQSMDGIFESNYLYNYGQSQTAYDASGMSLGNVFNMLIDNNITQKGKPGIVPFGPYVNSVYAYNYSINAYTGDDFLFSNMWGNHSNGADYNLYEGDITDQWLSDQTHGSDMANTGFRNFFTGYEACGNGACGSLTAKHNNVWPIQDTSNGRYWNIIANVLGTPQVATVGQVYSNNSYLYFNGSGLGYVYNLASGNQSISNAFPIDPYLIATDMIWGNWEAFSSSNQWNSSSVPSGISVYPNPVPTTTCTSTVACPASFYLSARPAWYPSSKPFPLIGPEISGGNVGQCGGTFPPTSGQYTYVAATNASQCGGQGLNSAFGTHVNSNPAMDCYLGLGGNPDGTSGAIAFDANTCYPANPSVPGAPLISGMLVNGMSAQ